MPEAEVVTVHRSLGLHIRAIDEAKRTAAFVASTDAVDSYGEIVKQTWDLTRYLDNPVVLFAHASRELPIGKCIEVGVKGGQLECVIQFATAAANPVAENVWQSVLEKTLRALSVGFNPRTVTYEKRDDKNVYVLDDNELFEISVVAIPANPEALAKQRQLLFERASQPTASAQPGNTEKEGTDMDAKDLEKKNADLTDTNATLKKDLETARTDRDALRTERDVAKKETETVRVELTAEKAKVTALNERCATLETERKSQHERADKLATEMTGRDLDVLVGVKMMPTEKPGLVKLASLSPEIYAEQLAAIKSRPDMAVMGQQIPKEKNIERTTATGGEDGDDLEASVSKSLKSDK